MVRQIYAADALTRTGLTATDRAGHVDGHSVLNDGTVIAVIHNTGAGAHVVTFETPGTIDGLAIADRTISVPAGAYRFIGPFPKSAYQQSAADSSLFVDFDATPAEVVVNYIAVPKF